jgi:hypothetical protein
MMRALVMNWMRMCFLEEKYTLIRRLYRKQKVEFRLIETGRGMTAEDICVLRYELSRIQSRSSECKVNRLG